MTLVEVQSITQTGKASLLPPFSPSGRNYHKEKRTSRKDIQRTDTAREITESERKADPSKEGTNINPTKSREETGTKRWQQINAQKQRDKGMKNV